MRFLLVPTFNYPGNLSADSIFGICRDWARALVETMPDLAITIVEPELDRFDKHTRYKDPGGQAKESPHPRVHIERIPAYSFYDLEEVNVPVDFWLRYHPVAGEFPVDGVICTSAVKLLQLRQVFCTLPSGARLAPAFFSFDLLTRGLGHNEVSGVSEIELISQTIGQLAAYKLYESPVAQRMSEECARRFLSPSLVKRFLQDSVLAFSGFDDAQVAPLPLTERRAEFTVIVRGRLANSKNVDSILGLYNARFAAGHPVKVLLTTGNSYVPREVKDQLTANKSIEFLRLSTKREANEVMRTAHAFVMWSSHELFCVSMWEMLAAGLVGIVKDEPWLKGLLPPDYPFVFKTEVEAYAMLAEVQENHAAWVEKLAATRAWVVDKYAYRNTTSRLATYLREKASTHAHPTRRDFVVEMFRAEFAEKPREVLTIRDGIDILNARSAWGELGTKDGWSPRYLAKAVLCREIVWALEQLQFVDDLTSAVPTFRRVSP